MEDDGRLCLVFKAGSGLQTTSLLGLSGIALLLSRLAFSVLSSRSSGNHLRRVVSCCRCRRRCGCLGLAVRLWAFRGFSHFQNVAGIWQLLAVQLLLLRPREGVRKIDRHKALGELDGVELGAQRLDDLLPVTVRC